MTPALTVTNMSKSFAGPRVLDSVNLSIEPGEIRALVGENGCGKSTLIKILAGFHLPDDGAAVVDAVHDQHAGDPGNRADAGGERERSSERADDVRHHDDREPRGQVGVDREQGKPEDEQVEAEVGHRSKHSHRPPR